RRPPSAPAPRTRSEQRAGSPARWHRVCKWHASDPSNPSFGFDLPSQPAPPGLFVGPGGQREIAVAALGIAKDNDAPRQRRRRDFPRDDIAELRHRIPRERPLFCQPNQRLIEPRVVVIQLVSLAGNTNKIGAQVNLVVELVGPADAENRKPRPQPAAEQRGGG